MVGRWEHVGHLKYLTPFFFVCDWDVTVKQNLSYGWLLDPHTLGKLIFHIILLSVKQNLSYV